MARAEYIHDLTRSIRRGHELVALQESIVAKLKGWNGQAPRQERTLATFRKSLKLLEQHLRDVTAHPS